MHPQNQVKTLVSRVVHQKKAPGLLTICLKKKKKNRIIFNNGFCNEFLSFFPFLVLLNPPFSVSLHQTGKAGQLKVSWKSNISKYDKDDVIYRIRYSSKTLGETREVHTDTQASRLLFSFMCQHSQFVSIYSLYVGLWSSILLLLLK